MKSLALENYGVAEMNHAEMQETDGGFIWFVVGACLLLASCQSGNGNIQQESIGGNNAAKTSADSAKSATTTSVQAQAHR